MVRVYFETKNQGYADKMAIFETEELYMACLKVLEIEANKHRMIITESIDEKSIKYL